MSGLYREHWGGDMAVGIGMCDQCFLTYGQNNSKSTLILLLLVGM